MKIGLRTVKTAISAALAMIIAEKLGFQQLCIFNYLMGLL